MTAFGSMTNVKLQKHIRSVSIDTLNVIITAHARVRMRERNVLDAEVYACLREGSIVRPFELDPKTGSVVCRMESFGASGNLSVCAALDDGSPDVVVVTVIVT